MEKGLAMNQDEKKKQLIELYSEQYNDSRETFMGLILLAAIHALKFKPCATSESVEDWVVHNEKWWRSK